MVRISLFALLALSSATLGLATPVEHQVSLGDDTVRVADKWSYKDCGNPTDAIQIQSIKVTPDPPQPGKDLTVDVVGKAVRRIEDGAYADVTVKLGLVRLLHKQFDVCEEARNANASIQCPIEEGSYSVSQTVALPKEIPRGMSLLLPCIPPHISICDSAKFIVNVRGFTNDDDDMLCLDLSVDFIKNPFPRFGW
ncbi:hypothetical protein DXG03_007094 [Asterophora parasitica]|uniref:Phosphatidylglycerol/phosphatidylinositol transfer protein n=1 Tax=Asterophora parasitica TaxID=117018 RepID=A0A9P7KFZ6_9AGAR|nr:hypothetical protein DXG03_007094 [Asterophora parasitica]